MKLKDETDESYYRNRLADPSLLNHAISVQVNGFAVLAVPVGSTRRGGYLPCWTWEDAKRIFDQLPKESGFPKLRVVYWGDHDFVVTWGPVISLNSDLEKGRFLGYREDVIQEFIKGGHKGNMPTPAERQFAERKG
jgi:hypothetical protein